MVALGKKLSISLFIVIFLLTGFFLSFLPNSPVHVAVKLVTILLVAGVLVYLINAGDSSQSDSPSPPKPQEDTEVGETHSIAPTEEPTDKSVEEHFQSFLEALFPLIKQTLVCNTVVLLLINFYKKKFHIRHRLSDFDDRLSRTAFFPLNEGLPAIVLKNRTTLLENRLPENEHLLPYYEGPELPVKSFIAAPVFFNDRIIGVLCADSEVEESFSREDLLILKQFGDLLSIQLACSNKLYEYETENWNTRVLFDFSKSILKVHSIAELWEYLGENLSSEFGADRLSICERAGDHQIRLVYLTGHAEGISPGMEFPDNEGLIGWVFRKNQPLLVEDFSTKTNYIPRFRLKEYPHRQLQSLLAIPVTREDQVQYVICLESSRVAQFTEQHKKILETMANLILGVLDRQEILGKMREHAQIDPATQLGNARAFRTHLEKEIARSTQFGRPCCLQLLKVHPVRGEVEGDLVQRLMGEFVSFTLPHLQPTNYIFRLSDDLFAIIWPEFSAKVALPEIDRLNEAIAQRKAWINGIVEQVTTASGVVEIPAHGKSVSQLLEKARQALAKAESEGPNSVAVYQTEEINQGE